MLEWIGNPRSSIPVFSLYTHVPPTREDCSNTCTSNTSSSLVRCLAAESPAAPAPITHTRRSFRILLLEECFLLKSRAKKQQTSQKPQWSHSCQEQARYSESFVLIGYPSGQDGVLTRYGISHVGPASRKKKSSLLLYACLLFIVNIIILFFCFIELYPAGASELERVIGAPPPI